MLPTSKVWTGVIILGITVWLTTATLLTVTRTYNQLLKESAVANSSNMPLQATPTHSSEIALQLNPDSSQPKNLPIIKQDHDEQDNGAGLLPEPVEMTGTEETDNVTIPAPVNMNKKSDRVQHLQLAVRDIVTEQNVNTEYLDRLLSVLSDQPQTKTPDRSSLIIEKISLNESIEAIPLINQTWDVSDLGANVGLLEGTGRFPQDDRAMVFAGHAAVFWPLRGPFADLFRLLPGDKIKYVAGDKLYRYEVSRLVYATPSQVELILNQNGNQIVLVTCGEVDFSTGLSDERLIVTADLVSVEELIFNQTD